MKTASICNIGGRSTNDDTVTICKKLFRTMLYVGDGLGSYAGGKQASQTASDVAEAMFQKTDLLEDTVLQQMAGLANQAVLDVQQEKNGNMKTTMVVLTVSHGKARWMHVGDSRIYHFLDGKIVHQSQDHSVSQVAAIMGDIEPSQIRFHEDRNKVLRAIGSESFKPDVSAVVPLKRGLDAFLLCTDGFWEYVYESEMEKTLAEAKNPGQWLDAMEKILLSRAGKENDNYTAAALFF